MNIVFRKMKINKISSNKLIKKLAEHLLPVSLMVLLIFIQNCSSERMLNSYKQYDAGQLILLSRDIGKPTWTKLKGGIGQVKGGKYVYFRGTGDSVNLTKALIYAKNNAKINAVTSINLIVEAQFVEAWNSLGIKESREMKLLRKRIKKSVLRIHISRLKFLERYNEQLGIVSRMKKKRPLIRKRINRVYVLYGIDYESFISLRNRFIKKLSSKKSQFKRKKLTAKLCEVLDQVDGTFSYKLDLVESKK